MSKADKMLEACGLPKWNDTDNSYGDWDKSYFNYIVFQDIKTVDIGETVTYDINLHLAIHEKMKDLGWI